MIVWVVSYGELPEHVKRTADCCVIGVAATEDEGKALAQADLNDMSPGLFAPLEFTKWWAPSVYDNDMHRWQAEIKRKDGKHDSCVFVEPFAVKGVPLSVDT